MATLKVSGLDTLKQATAAKYTQRRENFNASLMDFVSDWQKAADSTWAHREGLKGIKKLFKVTPLSRKQGTVSKARIEIKIRNTSLSAFPIEQVRVTTANRLLKVTVKNRKYRDRIVENMLVVTKVKLLKAGNFQTVVVKGKVPSVLAGAKHLGIKGYYYDKRSAVDALPSTPSGIYARLQQPTWRDGERLPTYKLSAPPLAYLVNSNRVKLAFNWEKRMHLLADSLKSIK